MKDLKSKVCQFFLEKDDSTIPDEETVSGVCENIRANVVHYFHHYYHYKKRIINNRLKLHVLQLQLE